MTLGKTCSELVQEVHDVICLHVYNNEGMDGKFKKLLTDVAKMTSDNREKLCEEKSRRFASSTWGFFSPHDLDANAHQINAAIDAYKKGFNDSYDIFVQLFNMWGEL